MRDRYSRWSGAGVALASLLLAAACGGGDGTAATGGTTDQGSGSGSGGGQTKDELVIGVAVEPETLDLANAADTLIEAWQYLDPIVQRLPDGTFRPMLAESLPEQPDPADPLTWHVTLRADATFHDGSPVDAASVVEWMEYVASFEPRTKEIVDVAQTFTPTAVDGRTIEIVFKTPGAAGVGINSAMSRFLVAKPGTPNMDSAPIGTGPFELVKWNRGQSLVLERYDGYWGEAPPVESVEFRYIPDAGARVASLQSGEVDIVTDLNNEDAQAVPATITGPSISWFGFVPDAKGKFSDVRLRQAMYHALDLDAIFEGLYGGLGQIPECQFGDDGYTGFNQDLERYEYDVERAKELVAEAGAEGLSFTLLAAPNQLRFAEVAETAVDMWRAIGLDPKLDLVPFEQFVPQVTAVDAQPDIYLLARGMETLDYEGYTVIAHPTSGLSSNDDTELHGLLDEAAQTADFDERESLLQEVAARNCEQVYGIPVMNPSGIFGIAEGIDFESSPYGARFTRVADMSFG